MPAVPTRAAGAGAAGSECSAAQPQSLRRAVGAPGAQATAEPPWLGLQPLKSFKAKSKSVREAELIWGGVKQPAELSSGRKSLVTRVELVRICAGSCAVSRRIPAPCQSGGLAGLRVGGCVRRFQEL